jgi:hypothetical protein
MNSEQPQLNPRHQPNTISTASVQSFEDPEGGLPLDSLGVKAREQQCRGRPTRNGSPQLGALDNKENAGA